MVNGSLQLGWFVFLPQTIWCYSKYRFSCQISSSVIFIKTQTRCLHDTTIMELRGYRKISWFVSVSPQVAQARNTEYRRASALLRNILACEQALCLGKNSKEREGKGGGGREREAFSLFPLPTPLNQRPVHRLVTFKIQGFVWGKTYRFCNLRKWKDFIKKQLTLLKMCVTSLLCGPRADLWPFYGFYVNGFLSI